MHIHILGIGGTFMGGIAHIACALGHKVSGSDNALYPPMSDQLAALNIDLRTGYSPDNLVPAPDLVIVGNALSRGNPEVEALLDGQFRFTSGPQWLADNVLKQRWTCAVAGTHGKTTTSSMLAYILDRAGLEPGFLIGGVPCDFDVSARVGAGRPFVVEADEYDTAFFDKRAKFVHYGPRTLVLNNLEFDHADIFRDLDDIKRQFHHLVRTVPRSGEIIFNANDPHLAQVLDMGCWSTRVPFHPPDVSAAAPGAWGARLLDSTGAQFEVHHEGHAVGTVKWNLYGAHNVTNAIAAIAAACHAGVSAALACETLAGFTSVKRRLESIDTGTATMLYDDFAHHPTAMRATLGALRSRVGKGRIIAVVEPRSNTLRMGVHRSELAAALSEADDVVWYRPSGLDWDLAAAAGPGARVMDSIEAILDYVASRAGVDVHVVLMSNGGFEGMRDRMKAKLSQPLARELRVQ